MDEGHLDVRDSDLEDTPDRLSLFDIISAGQNALPMLNHTKERLQSLKESLQFAANKTLRESLMAELEAAEATSREVERRMDQMQKILERTEVVILGKRLSALQAFKFLIELGKACEALHRSLQTCKPPHFELDILRNHGQSIYHVIEHCFREYKTTFQGAVMALKTFYVPEEDEDDLRVVWETGDGSRTVKYRWDKDLECWVAPKNIQETDQLRSFIKDASEVSREQGGWPHGTTATVTGTPGPDGWTVTYTIP